MTLCMNRTILFVLLCYVFMSLAGAKTVEFTILTFNDFYTVERGSDGKGGFASLSSLLQEQRARSKYHITTVNGDFLFPSILSSYDHGFHRVDLMNDLGVDLVVLGNHEFDFGIDVLKKRIREARFLCLAANAFGLDDRPFTGDQQIFIVDVEGIKVGFFGLITVETPILSSTEKRVNFTPIAYTARQMVKQLKNAGVDVIVALTHLFIDDDLTLAREVPEIDVILGGHDHEPITWHNGRTLVHKSGQNAQFLARIDLQIRKNDMTRQIDVHPSWEVLCNCRAEEDPVIAAKISALEKGFESYAMQPIASISCALDSTWPGIRTKESSMGNLIADAIRHSTGAEAAIICGGVLRGDRLYRPGETLTLKDLLGELPFNNLNVAVEMTGDDILEALENGVSQVEGKAGKFPQVSGMEYIFDRNRKPGRRIRQVKINGHPLDPAASYKVATLDYLLNGGDGYASFKKGRVVFDVLQHQETVQSVIDYVRNLGEITCAPEKRIISYEPPSSLDDRYISENGGIAN